MSISDYILFTGLFVVILATQLGRREPDAKRLIMPLVLVGAVGFKYVHHLPSGSVSHLLELGGVLVGVAFGLASIVLMKVERNPENGKLVTKAGWGYAAVWTAALAGRLAFAYGSTHWFEGSLAGFSMAHHVPGATYGAAFVLMVVAMIAVRTIAIVVRANKVGAPVDFSRTLSKGGRSGELVGKNQSVVR
jgi:hypothetical protein